MPLDVMSGGIRVRVNRLVDFCIMSMVTLKCVFLLIKALPDRESFKGNLESALCSEK